ncbi:DMP19 family protein [Pseudomonas sp. CGJS7]|uniref:DMP19 family protein n=1 Tax=Pseudomonas sp. CGJS7 TaxID=3109348 RepID=UPI0030093AF0
MNLPRIDWSGLLEAAPYFNSALIDTVDPERAAQLPPLPRAAWYWDVFNGEVSNGGFTQYLFNQGLSLPAFEQVPEFIAAHPQLQEALPFVQLAHQAWAELRPQFEQARRRDEWPERLFADHAERFEAAQQAFFALNHGIACRMHGAIVQAPHEYFRIEPIDGVPERGVAHVRAREGWHRLRFKDGFPVGPNLLETPEGQCDVVWFSDDRGTVESERGGYGRHARQWLHFASLTSASMDFEAGRLRVHQNQRALWERHGLGQRFSADGSVQQQDLHLRGEELLCEFFDRDGGLNLRIEAAEQGKRRLRFWPDGALNVESFEDPDAGATRYLRCLDRDGTDLAPGGDGRLLELIEETPRRRLWLEGRLREGLLDGDLRRIELTFRDGSQREISRTRYVRGVESAQDVPA